MRIRFAPLVFLILISILPAEVTAHQAGLGSITGRVSITDPEGTVFYGDWVRVFLTAKPIEVPEVDPSSSNPMERRARINSGHTAFYINFQRCQNEPGYLIDHKLTRPDGTFAFYGIAPGRYWILVTFPTIIAGYKSAWQVSVDVTEGQSTQVTLDGGNLAIPSY